MVTDQIADLLTRIRNALTARHSRLVVPHSKMKEAVVRLLHENDFLDGYSVTSIGGFKMINIELGAGGELPKLQSLQRMSKPGRRVYIACSEIPLVLGGRGMVVVSTSGGVMSGREARRLGLGGELVCKVW